ncbi:MAG: restriction endonuclease, partial [Polyangiaceae bacterium]|nr:restriction endonuclease [Polyangiaceae bacterium]
TVPARSKDKGIDVVADIEVGITSVREVVQAKRHAKAVQRKELDALRGCLHRFKAVRGTLITTGTFSRGTIDAAIEAGAAPITLIDGAKLVDLLIEFGVGVKRNPIETLEIIHEVFAADATPDAGR